jgi:hypothetical protein
MPIILVADDLQLDTGDFLELDPGDNLTLDLVPIFVPEPATRAECRVEIGPSTAATVVIGPDPFGDPVQPPTSGPTTRATADAVIIGPAATVKRLLVGGFNVAK